MAVARERGERGLAHEGRDDSVSLGGLAGTLATCDWLVNVASCDWRALNTFGCNAAQWAAQSGDVRMCQWLARLGLDMTLLNNNGHSAVHKAAVKGRRETCEWLLEKGGLGGTTWHRITTTR